MDRPCSRLPLTADGLTARFRARWLWALLALGIGLRLLRYALNFPMWADEAMLASSFRDRTYAELLEPLDFFQVAPILYLWVVKSAVSLFGFETYALRLVSVVAAVASVPLFAWVALRINDATRTNDGLSPSNPSRALTSPISIAALLAIAIFAVAYYPVRYAAEIKPYASDLLLSLAMTALAVGWLRSRKIGTSVKARAGGRSIWLWWLALLAPLAVGFSYPSVFVAGGVVLGLTASVWRRPHGPNDLTDEGHLNEPNETGKPNGSARAAWFIAGSATIAAFLANYLLVVKPQYEASTSATLNFWEAAFPPITDPLGMVKWFFSAHTGRMFGYPVGGSDGGSSLTFILMLAGIVAWWRTGKRDALAVLLAPLGLLFVAACLKKYPYGGSGRVFQHVVPAICLLMGVGIHSALQWLTFRKQSDRSAEHENDAERETEVEAAAARANLWYRRITGVLVVLAAFGAIQLIGMIAKPYRYPNDRDDRALARKLWQTEVDDYVTVCAVNDLKLPWLGETWQYLDGAKYVSNQALFIAPDRPAPDWSLASPARPLRVIMPAWPEPSRAVIMERTQWRTEMTQTWTLVDQKLELHGKPDGSSHTLGWWVEVFTFVPRAPFDEAAD